MRYTLLRLTDQGIVLCAYHERRLGLGAGGAVRDAFRRFAEASEPGVWAVHLGEAGDSLAERRAGTRLHEGMAIRFAHSPVADRAGPLPKPSSPCVYDAVREDGVATLLTSPDGGEIYEACSAAVLGWDGGRVVCVPGDRPRVWSTAEAAVREHLTVTEAPIPVRATMPILLVNAVKGPCTVTASGRAPFPAPAIRDIEQLFARLTGR